MGYVRARAAVSLALAVAAALMTGCSSSDDGSPQPAQGQPKAPDTPEGTLTELVKRIGDGRAAEACGLFVPGGQTLFAQEFQAADCVSAMQIVIGRVTDPKSFASAQLKPSGKYPGVQVEGDSATFGGSCSGWVHQAGVTGMEPSDLGRIKLKKTPDGWFIYEVRLPSGSCGG